MVPKTRLETVTRSVGLVGLVCCSGAVEEHSEGKRMLVASRGAFEPFCGSEFCVIDGGSVQDITPFLIAPDVFAEGEEGLQMSTTVDVKSLSWIGGGGARYFTLFGCD